VYTLGTDKEPRIAPPAHVLRTVQVQNSVALCCPMVKIRGWHDYASSRPLGWSQSMHPFELINNEKDKNHACTKVLKVQREPMALTMKPDE